MLLVRAHASAMLGLLGRSSYYQFLRFPMEIKSVERYNSLSAAMAIS